MRIAGNVSVDVMKEGTIDEVIASCKECIIKMCGQSGRLYFEYRMSIAHWNSEGECRSIYLCCKKIWTRCKTWMYAEGIMEEA